jgi:general secretion pathway protein I
MTIKHPGQGGFTLLEVLLAFVIFALSFAVTLEILTGAIRNTSRAREHTEAALIAQSIMDQVGLDIPLRSGSSIQGEEGEYRWEVDIHPFQGEISNMRSIELVDIVGVELLEVECIISWGNMGRERSQYFSTVKAIREGEE